MNVLTQIDTLDDRELLMLADYIADKLSEDLADCVAPGIAQAFDAIEEGRSYQHTYPAGLPAIGMRDRWAAWNAYRDNRLSFLLGARRAA